MAGIFQNGVWSTGFDLSPSSSQIFSMTAAGVASTTFLPYNFGFSYMIGSVTPAILLNTNLTTLIVGLIFYPNNGLPSTDYVITFYDATAGAIQVALRVNSTGQLQFFLGTSTSSNLGSASAAGTVQQNVWVYIEAAVTISATVGIVQCNVNGTNVIYASGLNTKSTANTYVNAVQIRGFTNPCYIDDFYMLDGTASSPLNAMLGPVQVREDKASAVSAVTGGRNNFTHHGLSTNLANIQNAPANAADYNDDSTVGDWDQYAFPALPAGATSVLWVNALATLLLDSAGSRTVSLNQCSVSGGTPTDNLGAAFGLTAGPVVYNYPQLLAPGSVAWTPTNAGNIEIGVKVVS